MTRFLRTGFFNGSLSYFLPGRQLDPDDSVLRDIFEKSSALIIENSAMMRSILREMLREFGVSEIVVVHNGEEGIDAIKERAFDFIILDFFLGKLDGGDFTRLLRRNTRNPNRKTPILLITALPGHEKVVKSRDCGINELLAKPISAKALYLRLHSMLTKPRPFIDTDGYMGPCRRRRQLALPECGERRKSTAQQIPATEAAE